MIFWLPVGVMEMMVWSFTRKGFKQIRSRHRHQEKEVPSSPKLWMNTSPLIYSHHYHIYHHCHQQHPPPSVLEGQRLGTRAAALWWGSDVRSELSQTLNLKGSNKHLSHHLSCRQLSATFKTHFSIPQPCSYSSHPPLNSPKASLYPASSHVFLGCFIHLLGPRGSLLPTLKPSFKDRPVLLGEGFWNHKVYSWITKTFVTNLVYLLIF